MIRAVTFETYHDVQTYCNFHKIKKSNIIAITCDAKLNYKYTLFWEDEYDT